MTTKRTFDNRHTKGDFTLVSSDEVVFKIPKFYMLAASSVIRDMYVIGTADDAFELELDSTDETAHVVRLWVGLLAGDAVPDSNDIIFNDLHKGLSLCRRFDCPAITRGIMMAVRARMDDSATSSFEGSLIAARYGLDDSLEKIVRTRGRQSWSTEPRGKHAALHQLKGGLIRDLSSWSLDNFCRLPHVYCWALLRSSQGTTTMEEHADKLKTILALIKERAGESKANVSKTGL